MKNYKSSLILIINPGSTSLKIGVYSGEREILYKNFHIEFNMKKNAQKNIMVSRELIINELNKNTINISDIEIFVARGGLLRPVKSSIYLINRKMLNDLKSNKYGRHAANLGALIAFDLAQMHNKKSIISPELVDELDDISRITGIPCIEHKSIFHALNQKAVANITAQKLKKSYNKCNFIIAHIGGGITIGAHKNGRVIDVNNGLEGDGPFTPERSGSIPLNNFFTYINKQHLSTKGVFDLITKKSGLKAHLGTNDCSLIEKKILKGDKKFTLIYNSFIYQIAKSICAQAAALCGKIDGIILTGGVAQGKIFQKQIKKRIKFLGKIFIYTQNQEMHELAKAGYEILTGKCKPYNY